MIYVRMLLFTLYHWCRRMIVILWCLLLWLYLIREFHRFVKFSLDCNLSNNFQNNLRLFHNSVLLTYGPFGVKRVTTIVWTFLWKLYRRVVVFVILDVYCFKILRLLVSNIVVFLKDKISDNIPRLFPFALAELLRCEIYILLQD